MACFGLPGVGRRKETKKEDLETSRQRRDAGSLAKAAPRRRPRGSLTRKGGSKIGGSVTTVNGDIDMSQTEISYHLRTTNGDMHISDNSVIEGDIVYETVSKNQWKRSQHPKLRIEKGSTVKGAIILKRPVKLHIDDPALLAKVQKHFHTNE